MSSVLKFTKWVGMFPLKVEKTTSQLTTSVWISCWFHFNQLLVWIISIAFFCDGLANYRSFSKIFFSITDRAFIYFGVAANMFVLWKLRFVLLETWNKNLRIIRAINPTWTLTENKILLCFTAGLAFTTIASWIAAWFAGNWKIYEGLLIGLGFVCYWYQNIIFYSTYAINTQTIKILNTNLEQYTSNEIDLKHFQRIFLTVMLNTQKMSSVFHFFLVITALNFFAQLLGLYDFATPDLQLGNVAMMILITTLVHQFLQFGSIVWVSLQPCYALRETTAILENLGRQLKSAGCNSEIEIFNMQIIHIDVEINAYGVAMNFETIGKHLSQIIGYQLILLQFKQNLKI